MIEQLSVIVFTNGYQLTAMLPGIGPGAVGQHAALGIVAARKGIAVVRRCESLHENLGDDGDVVMGIR